MRSMRMGFVKAAIEELVEELEWPAQNPELNTG